MVLNLTHTDIDERKLILQKPKSGNQADLAVFPNLKPTTKAISLRLPESMLAQIKAEANKRDVPYQSLMKIWLSEHLPRAT